VIPLTRPAFGPEEEDAVREVLRSGWVAQGPATAAFEREFERAVGVAHAIAVSSCTTALHLAVLGGRIGPGDEVILPSFTFPATANAVLYAGGTPVLVDVDPRTLNIDLEAVAQAAGPRTRAVIGVHLFGFPCEIGALESFCAERGLFLIEDAACAVGTRIGNRMAGTFGDVACFSFHARKVVTCGEGGMLTTRRDDLAAELASLRTHGADRGADLREGEGLAPPSPRHVRLGYNYRLSDVQSAIARAQLGRLEAFVAEREELARRYDEALSDLRGVQLPPRGVGLRHSWQSYVVVLGADAKVAPRAFRDALAAKGVATRPGTYAVHLEPYWRERFPVPSLPHSEWAAERSVALPLFNGMSWESQRRVIESVHHALQAAR
jgi:dTDP-4-amino-4,6-dideoxygalactose transaminase